MARLTSFVVGCALTLALAAAQATSQAPGGGGGNQPPVPGRCAWSQLAGEPCPLDRGCAQNPDLQLCFDPKCGDSPNATACQQRDGCVWNGTRCKDYNLNFGIPDNFWCSAVKDERVCAQIAPCAWNPSVGVCLNRAGFAPPPLPNPNCTAATLGACSLAEGCVWFQDMCFLPRCRSQKNATMCNRLSRSCRWLPEGEGACVDVAFAVPQADNCSAWRHPAACLSSRRCGWSRERCVEGLNKSPNRIGGCSFVTDPARCNASFGCVFEPQLNRCFDPNCPRLETADKCRNVSGCTWYRNECIDQLQAFGTHPCSNLTAMDLCRGKCGWSPSTRTCLPLAGTCSFATVANCPAGCSSNTNTSVCASTACPASAANGQLCDRSLGCVTFNGRCVDYNVAYGRYPCDQVRELALCGGACQWNNGMCIPGGDSTPCSQLRQDDKRFCPERCGYDDKLKMCYERRCAGLAKADCVAQTTYGCAWRNSVCLDQNVQFGFYECRLAPTPQLCGGRCAWQNNQCVVQQACAFGPQGDPNQCARPRCSFEPQVGFCLDPMCGAQSTSEACADRQGCAWRDGKCWDYNIAMKAFDCGRVQNASFCGGRCRFDAGASRCVFDPSKVPCAELQQGDEKQCNTTRCVFDQGSRQCYDLQCSGLASAAQCAQRPGCAWKGGEKGRCHDRNVLYRRYPCNGVAREEACQGQCEWDVNATDAARRCRPRTWLPSGCTPSMRDTEVSLLNSCLDPVRAVERLGANVNVSYLRDQIERVCGNAECAAALNATKCATEFLAYAQTLCTRMNASDASSDRCGVALLSRQMSACGGIAPTDPSDPSSAERACNATAACRFNVQANRCEFRPTQDVLALQCAPCVRKYKDIERLVDQRRGVVLEREDPMEAFDVTCARVKKTYCMTRFSVAQLKDFKPRDFNPDQLSRLCNAADSSSGGNASSAGNASTSGSSSSDNVDLRCFQKLATAVMKRRTATAQASMMECARSVGLTGGPDCSAEFQGAMQQQREFDAMLASMCTRAPDGRFCVTLPKTLANKSQTLQQCFASVVQRGDACNSECDAALKAEIDTWGCCAGTLQRIFGDADIKDRVARELTVAQKQAPPDTANAAAGGSAEVQRAARVLLQSPPPQQGGSSQAPQQQGGSSQAPQQQGGSSQAPQQGGGSQAPQQQGGGSQAPQQGGSQAPQQGGSSQAPQQGNGSQTQQQQQDPQPRPLTNARESGFLANLRQCTSYGETGAKTATATACNVTFAPQAQKRRLYLGIAWSALQSDSSLSSGLLDAVTEDMQALMGVSSDKMPNITLGEAPNVAVTVTTTSARGMKVLATSSGVYVESTVQDSSASATSESTGEFDSSVTDQTVTLSSTSDALESLCSDASSCVDTSSSSLVNYQATSAEVTTTAAPATTATATGETATKSAKSGAAAVSALAGAAIAALVAVALG